MRGLSVLLEASGRLGASSSVILVKFCPFPSPFLSRPHSESVPYPGNAQPPARPGDAGEGRAAQAKLLSCGASSEVAAVTAASRPLPGLRRLEHTPTGHRPLPALSLAARPGLCSIPTPRPQEAQVSSAIGLGAGGGRTPPPRSAWGRGRAGSPPPAGL